MGDAPQLSPSINVHPARCKINDDEKRHVDLSARYDEARRVW
jgi:hypothetical protein